VRAVVGLLCVVALFLVDSEAKAAVTASFDGTTLVLSGTAEDESLTLTGTATTITISAPGGVTGACEPDVPCTVDPNATVRADLGLGQDSFDAAALGRNVWVVAAGDGRDTVRAGSGADTINLQGADNEVWAGAGGDVISGAGLLHGEAGPDFISGDGLLDGGPGDDRLEGVFVADLDGGDGRDTVSYSRSSSRGAHISLDGQRNDGALAYAGNVTNAEVLLGSDLADILVGDGGAQELRGGAGQDVLSAGAGDDTIAALDGERDEVDCGAGDDHVTADAIDVLTACAPVIEDPEPPDNSAPAPDDSPPPDDSAPPPDESPAPGDSAPPPGSPPPLVAASPPARMVFVDAVAPVVGVRVPSRVRAARGVATSVRCSEACSVKVELRVADRLAKRYKLPRVLASRRGRMAAAGTLKLTVKPRASVRRKLVKAKRTLKATLVTIATDGAGNARSVKRTVKLSR
jgi:hypothetical protein